MRLIPEWHWLWTPSGGAFVEVGFWPRLWRRVRDAPLLAHPIGAWALVLCEYLIGIVGAAGVVAAVAVWYAVRRKQRWGWPAIIGGGVTLLGVVLPAPVQRVWPVYIGESVNQWFKGSRGDYGDRLWLNVIWRILLSAVATLPAWWL